MTDHFGDVSFKDDLLKQVFDANIRILGIIGSYGDPVAARQAAEQILAVLNKLDKQNALHAEKTDLENWEIENTARIICPDPLFHPLRPKPTPSDDLKSEVRTGEACPHQRRNLRPLRGRARLASRIG